jgi:hypothetical protein
MMMLETTYPSKHMYKATRTLIKARQPHSPYVIEVVTVQQVGGGRANDCFNNACEVLERIAGSTIASGWLVKKFNPIDKSTEIVQHFWNVDKNGMHFDTTPVTENGLEYVDDCELNEYGQANLENLTDCVASSLLLKDEKFYAVNKVDERMLINPIESLNTRTLFRVAAIKF